jgi:hypothetical protein
MELLQRHHDNDDPQYRADAHAVKTKLEQEALVLAAKRAESNSSLSKVKANIEIFRQQLDHAAKRRAFCLNANNFYNELERLDRLEKDFKCKKVHYGCTNAEERGQQLEQDRVKEYEARLYKECCVAARQYQQKRDDIWSHLEALIQQREILKAQVQDIKQLLLVLLRATGGDDIRGGNDVRGDRGSGDEGDGGGCETGEQAGETVEGVDVSHDKTSKMRTSQRATMRHARQLTSGDREMWETTMSFSTKQGAIENKKFTDQELSDLQKKHRDDPQWLKLITLIKLKQEVDQRIQNKAGEGSRCSTQTN